MGRQQDQGRGREEGGSRERSREGIASAAMAEPQQLSKNQKKKAREKVRHTDLYKREGE